MVSSSTVAALACTANKQAKAKNGSRKPSHPRTSEMVTAAIATLEEKGGSSLQAIKKYIATAYGLDAEKLSPFIKKYLKSGVVAEKLVQTKGCKGAAGSFKLSEGKIKSKPKAGKPQRSIRSQAKKKETAARSNKDAAKKATVSKPKRTSSPKKGLAAKPPKPKVSRKAPPPAKPVAHKRSAAKK